MRRRTLVIGTSAVAAVALAGPAIAYWTLTSNSGQTTYTSTSLGAPAGVSASPQSAGAFNVTVTAGPASGPTPASYGISRVMPSPTPTVTNCGAKALNAACSDNGLSANTYYWYRAQSNFGTNWVSGSTKNVLASPSPQSGFYVSSIALNNKTTNTAGELDAGDTVSIVFSGTVHQSTICSGWNTDTADPTLNANNKDVVSLNDNAGATGDDTLTFSTTENTCSSGVHIGTIDLGSPNFVSGGSYTFKGQNSAATSFSFSHTTKTLTITLGTAVAGTGASLVTDTRSNIAIFAPDSTIKDTTTPTPNSISGNAGVQATLF